MSTTNDRNTNGQNETTKMFFESMKKTLDVIEVNLPVGASIAVIQASDLRDWISIGVGIIGAICTILVTRQKLKQKDKNNE